MAPRRHLVLVGIYAGRVAPFVASVSHRQNIFRSVTHRQNIFKSVTHRQNIFRSCYPQTEYLKWAKTCVSRGGQTNKQLTVTSFI